ncbi:MAG: ABC transporter ATPase [Flavobacteriaceae bacterium]|nr:ABC transporter ATPase [Flavobacteriaceae bacterium]
MLVNFSSLPDNSKIWIYQSSRKFLDTEVSEISSKMEQFITNWKRHGDDLKGSYQIKYNQFIVLAVDQSYNEASGCSVDASTHVFKQFEVQYQVDLFNKMNTAFKDGDNINIVSLSDFQNFINQQKINTKTIVFNNLINTKKELETVWEVSADKSWHSRYFK